MKIKKIFLASSSELAADRMDFELFTEEAICHGTAHHIFAI
jgi:hypothetical protein